jgi:hypothetical protein
MILKPIIEISVVGFLYEQEVMNLGLATTRPPLRDAEGDLPKLK